MTFASVAALSLLTLIGLGVVAAAFNARRLIAWENRALGALADTLRARRLAIEEDILLLSGTQPVLQTQTQLAEPAPQRGSRAA